MKISQKKCTNRNNRCAAQRMHFSKCHTHNFKHLKIERNRSRIFINLTKSQHVWHCSKSEIICRINTHQTNFFNSLFIMEFKSYFQFNTFLFKHCPRKMLHFFSKFPFLPFIFSISRVINRNKVRGVKFNSRKTNERATITRRDSCNRSIRAIDPN